MNNFSSLLSDATAEVDADRHAIGGSTSTSGRRRAPMAMGDFFAGGSSGDSLSSLAGLPSLNAQPAPTQLETEELPDGAAHDYLTESDPNNPRYR